MAIPTGGKAPDFTLKRKTADGVVDVKLSDNFGQRNTVILFFPLAFTGVCTREMCDLSGGGLAAYESLNAAVYAVSVDSPFAQEAWALKERITLPLLSDLNKKTAEAYGVLLHDLLGLGSVSARAAFVVDQDGLIRYSEQTPTPKDLPNFAAIQQALKTL
ncbi:MAG: redoxin domain-containing protein [Verrucomicrobiales bacterium]|jgi:peroxiredoxin|nr:redoxin domain-containing protein [Verrucomicrobiales bacterium]